MRISTLPLFRSLAILSSLFMLFFCGVASAPSSASASTQPAFYVAASNGNDSWSGTLAAPNLANTDGPFKTIAKAQSAMENSTTTKTAIVRGGTYSIASNWNFDASVDNGETWLAYQGETPILDGGGTGSITRSAPVSLDHITVEGFTIKNLSSAGWDISFSNNMTIRWNTFLNCIDTCIQAQSVNTAFIDSNTINGQSPGNVPGPNTNAYFAINLDSGASGNVVSHNLIENTEGGAIGFSTAGTPDNNNIVDRNILRNVVMNAFDNGAIYMEDSSHVSTGNQITNNIVDGSGTPQPAPGTPCTPYSFSCYVTHAIYLDDNMSSVLVSGNIIRNSQEFATIIHGGDHNTIQNNIFDLTQSIASQLDMYQSSPTSSQFGMAGNVFTKNIVYFATSTPSALYLDYATMYGQAAPTTTGNMYYSAAAASIPNAIFADSAPLYADPLFSNPAAGNYLMPSSSPAYAQMGFQALPTDQGPLPSPFIGSGSSTIGAFYVSPLGNDSWSGTIASPNAGNTDGPFKTLAKAQVAMENSTTTKTTYLRAGTYSLMQGSITPSSPTCGSSACGCPNALAAIQLTNADNGETWSYYPPDGYNSAILDGGAPFVTQSGPAPSASGLLGCAFASDSATGPITITGLAFQFWRYGAVDVANGTYTITDNIIHDNTLPADGGLPIALSCTSNSTISGNYIYNSAFHGIGVGSCGNGAPISNLAISNNFILNSCTWAPGSGYANGGDCGAIYVQLPSPSNSNIKITNNYIRDVNALSKGVGSFGICCAMGVYLDGATYNVTVSDNVITGIKSFCFSTHGGGNRFTGNLCDIGYPGPYQFIAGDVYSDGTVVTGGNVFQNNIVLSDQTGAGGGYNAAAICSPASSTCLVNPMAVSNNAYFNYVGSTVNSGGLALQLGDSNPVYENPQINCASFTIASSSPVFNSPVNFPGIIGGWGPPGFAIPQTGTLPSWLIPCGILPVTVSLTAAPASITNGATSTLSWSSTNATSCTSSFTTATSTSGMLVVTPLATTAYSINCTGIGNSASALTTITVALPLPGSFLNATPASILKGATSTLTWSSTNATTCLGTNFSTASSTSGTLAVMPLATTLYTLTCSNAAGFATATTSITVTAPPLPTASLSATPASIIKGATSTLTWSSNNATICTGTNFKTGSTTSGTLAVAPVATTTYSVSCTGLGGSASATTTVNVTVLPLPTASLAAAPASIVLGTNSTLTWSSKNATSCTGTNFSTASSTSGTLVVAPKVTTTYSLTCIGAGGTAATSTTVKVTPDTTAPSVPANLKATAISSAQINLSWAASTDNVAVTGYKLYRGTLQIATLTASTTSYADSGLSPFTSYSYAVSAFDAAGNVSAKSASVSTTTWALPPLKVGGNVVTIAKLNVRSKPNTTGSSQILGTQNTGATGTITQGPQSGSGYTWWYVNFASGADGWVQANYIQTHV